VTILLRGENGVKKKNQATGDRRQATGDRRQATGGRRQEADDETLLFSVHHCM